MPGLKQRDARQLRFQAYYANPKSSTFTNTYQSAIKAGYSVSYAKQITYQSPKILSEALVIYKGMLTKVERNLEEMLSVYENEPVMTTYYGPMKDRTTGQFNIYLNDGSDGNN